MLVSPGRLLAPLAAAAAGAFPSWARTALADEFNGGVIDFTDNSYAYAITPFATILLGDEPNGGVYDFTDSSFAQRSTSPAALMLGFDRGGVMDMPSNTYAIRT